MTDTVIVAPHGDDEIIGCFDELVNPKTKPIIIYTQPVEKKRQEEILKLKEHVIIKAQMFLNSIPQNLLGIGNRFYFPDPHFELHPAHRAHGMIGEQMARNGEDVIFYSTNMNSPYIREVVNPEAKKLLLDTIYPSQSDLWKYDHKYFLFEGACKWIF